MMPEVAIEAIETHLAHVEYASESSILWGCKEALQQSSGIKGLSLSICADYNGVNGKRKLGGVQV